MSVFAGMPMDKGFNGQNICFLKWCKKAGFKMEQVQQYCGGTMIKMILICSFIW